MLRLTTLFFALAVIRMAGAQPSPGAAFTETAVRSARARSNHAIALRDTGALVSLASPSYHSVSSRNVHTNGRDGVLIQWRQQFATHPDVKYVRTPGKIRLFAPWEMAEESGQWVGRWKEADGQVVISGAYTAKWRRVGGQWLLEAEVFTPLACKGSVYCTKAPD